MADDVREIVRCEAEVDGHDDTADLRDGIKRFEQGVGVGRDVGDAVTPSDAETLQRARPAVASIEELAVGVPRRAIDGRFVMRIEATRAAGGLERRPRDFHGPPPPTSRSRLWAPGFCRAAGPG